LLILLKLVNELNPTELSMYLLTNLSKPLATWVVKRQQAKFKDPVKVQKNVLSSLISKAENTVWGSLFKYGSIKNYDDFREAVPIRSYEELTSFIERIKKGEPNILWPERPLYFAKTSGTTHGTKYIPITKESIKNHLANARNALLYYIHETGRTDFMEKKMLYLSGSPKLEPYGSLLSGRLSGIVYYFLPFYLHKKYLPSFEISSIEDWEEKLNEIVKVSLKKPISFVAGIPPWLQMYFDKLIEEKGKPVGEIFPDLSLLMHGGVRFDPYRTKLFEALGRTIPTIETFPASEGFIAFQHSQESEGMLLQLDSGIFFEFIPVSDVDKYYPRRLSIGEVERGVEYALVLSTNAGLWAYPLGDTIRFISLNPPQIVVTGRTKQFISAFGEHVIVEEIENAMQSTLKQYPDVRISEYTVAPMVSQRSGEGSYHEWLIEFSASPKDVETFAAELDRQLCSRNIYYNDLIKGHILRPLQLTFIKPGGFRSYMREANKIGDQNKVIRVTNDRKIADRLAPYRSINPDK
jgi:hypothetical protein